MDHRAMCSNHTTTTTDTEAAKAPCTSDVIEFGEPSPELAGARGAVWLTETDDGKDLEVGTSIPAFFAFADLPALIGALQHLLHLGRIA